MRNIIIAIYLTGAVLHAEVAADALTSMPPPKCFECRLASGVLFIVIWPLLQPNFIKGIVWRGKK